MEPVLPDRSCAARFVSSHLYICKEARPSIGARRIIAGSSARSGSALGRVLIYRRIPAVERRSTGWRPADERK